MAIDVAEAMELYVYGYPLVYCTDEIAKLTDGRSAIFPQGVPFNRFASARELLGPDAEFVSPNNDTLYVTAPLDVSAGPVLLHTPDTAGRYFVLQFIDPWSNNFAYIGKRATGTVAADWLLTPADYGGEVPSGATVIELPNPVAVIVGRVQVDGEADLPAVHALQDAAVPAPSTHPIGRSPTARRPTSPEPSQPEGGSAATTATRPTTRSSIRTRTARPSTAATATRSPSTHRLPPTLSGR